MAAACRSAAPPLGGCGRNSCSRGRRPDPAPATVLLIPKGVLNAAASMIAADGCRPFDTSVHTGRMGQTSIERLRDYLAQLPPQSQALLMREFERAVERGQDATIANLVLEQLRKVVRGAEDEARPRTDDPARLLFRPLDPFLTDGNAVRPGQVRRASLLPVWQWVIRDGAPEAVREFEAALGRTPASAATSELEPAIRKLQRTVAEAFLKVAAPAPGG